MIAKTQMTIDAYLRQAGISSGHAATSPRFFSLTSRNDTPFKAVLHEAVSPDNPSCSDLQRGMTVSDYLARRQQNIPSAGLAMDRFAYALHRSVGQPAREDGVAKAPMPDSEAMIQRSIDQAARKYRLPKQLIESVIQAESDFRADAVSPAGAQGLMQLMPATAAELGVTDPFDVRQNIDGGSKYLRQMLDRFDGDLHLALAAYNAGPGTVERYQGEVPYAETRNYVHKVLSGMDAVTAST